MLDLAQNLNWLGPPAGFESVSAEMGGLECYPSIEGEEASEAISRFTGCEPEHAIAVNGSTEAIFDICLWREEPHIVTVSPTFWEYDFAARRAGKSTSTVLLDPNQGFAFDREAFASQIPDRSLVFLCNPNNPTSTLIERQELTYLASSRPDSMFIVDETYLLFRGDYANRTISKLVADLDNLMVVCSLSKFFATPGARLGFCVASTSTAASLRSWRIPYSVTTQSSGLMSWLLAHNEQYVRQTRLFYDRARTNTLARVRESLAGGAEVAAAEGPFVLVDFRSAAAKHETILDSLHKAGFAVRDGCDLANLGRGWIRTKLADESTMELFCGAFWNGKTIPVGPDR